VSQGTKSSKILGRTSDWANPKLKVNYFITTIFTRFKDYTSLSMGVAKLAQEVVAFLVDAVTISLLNPELLVKHVLENVNQLLLSFCKYPEYPRPQKEAYHIKIRTSKHQASTKRLLEIISL
jgi:hypothetical protein